MNKRTTGAAYEKLADTYLSQQGVRIAEHNFRVRQGEIDLIGYDGNTLVFFEVKYRKSAEHGLPQEAVGPKKQLQICKVAQFYRSFRHVPPEQSVRYDVVAICGTQVTWIKNAFPELLGGW